jgi:DNA repair ATPase RecN
MDSGNMSKEKEKSPSGGAHANAGARWVRTALQVNPYGYVGRSAPATKFRSEDVYNTAIIEKCLELGIEMIATTDHASADSSVSLIRRAEESGIVALPGFEVNSSEGVHLLVVFEAGAEPSRVNAAIGGCGVVPGSSSGETGKSFADIVAEMSKLGALVIPAHANVPSGGMLSGRQGKPLVAMVQDVNLLAIALCPSEAAAGEQENILKNRRPYKREHPIVEIHADDVCSPTDLEKNGATTWFKMSQPGLQGLQHAIRIPETRVALTPPTVEASCTFRSISWEGGFLDGVTVPLSSGLTAVIGGKGTGKSTTIESLRYALDLSPLGNNARSDHSSVIENVVQSGTTIKVEVEVSSPRPARYVISRTVPNAPIVTDASGTSLDLAPTDVTGQVEVFGQHELAEMAKDKTTIASMLRRFTGDDPSTAARDATRTELRQNRDALERAEREREQLEDELSEMPRLQAQVDRFKESDLPKRLVEQQQLSKDRAAIKEALERVEDVSGLLSNFDTSPEVARLSDPIEDIAESDNASLLQAAEKATTDLGTAMKSYTSTVHGAIKSAQDVIEGARTDLETVAKSQEAEHAKVVRELIAEGNDPDLFLTSTSRLSELAAKAKRRGPSDHAIKSLGDQRKVLLAQLAKDNAAVSQHLVNAIREANRSTTTAVNIRQVPSPNRKEIEDLIREEVRGKRTQIMEAIGRPDFDPKALASAARSGEAALEEEFGVQGAQARSLAGAGEFLFRRLEEMNVGQAVDVYLDASAGSGSTDYRRLEELSKGQRATALLLLLLGASSGPLIIDQPEDDLDNRFVYKEVVATLRTLKGRRQVIASTHNANIPVLGDAELIVTLEGSGQKGGLRDGGVGSLDEPPIREVAENLLEGGHDAFSARQHIYGF